MALVIITKLNYNNYYVDYFFEIISSNIALLIVIIEQYNV